MYYYIRWGGAFSRDFTANLTPQCEGLSRTSKLKKLEALLFPGFIEAVDTKDWCILCTTVSFFVNFSHSVACTLCC